LGQAKAVSAAVVCAMSRKTGSAGKKAPKFSSKRREAPVMRYKTMVYKLSGGKKWITLKR
jgi:hypothetical protein